MLKKQLSEIIDILQNLYIKYQFQPKDKCLIDLTKRNISDLPKICSEINESIDKYHKSKHDHERIDLLLLINRRLAFISWTIDQVSDEVMIFFSKLILQDEINS